MTTGDSKCIRCSHSQPFAGVPIPDQRALQQLGRQWNSDITANRGRVLDIYTRLLAQSDKSGLTFNRDIRYGSHERETLDVVQGDGDSRPVIAFYHGGAFTRGQKRVTSEIYENVLTWFAKKGFVGINVEYRLAPEIRFPQGALEVASSVEWIAENVPGYGGDPSRIVLIGHSAGGAHVASYLCDPNIGVTPHASVCAAVLLSARLKADQHPENPNAAHVRAYFGDDAESYVERSPLTYADRLDLPLFIAIAEYENRFLDSYGAMFFAKVAEARGRAPHFMQLSGHNHTSIVAHFDSGEERMGAAILRFLELELGITSVETEA